MENLLVTNQFRNLINWHHLWRCATHLSLCN